MRVGLNSCSSSSSPNIFPRELGPPGTCRTRRLGFGITLEGAPWSTGAAAASYEENGEYENLRSKEVCEHLLQAWEGPRKARHLEPPFPQGSVSPKKAHQARSKRAGSSPDLPVQKTNEYVRELRAMAWIHQWLRWGKPEAPLRVA